MKSSQWLLVFFAVSILLMSTKLESQTSKNEHDQPKQSDWMERTVPRFVMEAARDLKINILIVDGISFTATDAVYDKESSVSKEDLLNLFIAFLQSNGALLVKSGIICQIVPLSRDLGGRWTRITVLADIPSFQQLSGIPRRMSMRFAGASLSDFCAQTAKMLKITPIVIDPAVKGSVTLLTSLIPGEAVFPILIAVLDNNDAVLIESRGEYQIIPKSMELPEQWKVLTELPQSTLPVRP